MIEYRDTKTTLNIQTVTEVRITRTQHNPEEVALLQSELQEAYHTIEYLEDENHTLKRRIDCQTARLKQLDLKNQP